LRLGRGVLPAAGLVTATTAGIARSLHEAHHVPAGRLRVIPDGLSLPDAAGPARNAGPGRFRITYAGRFVPGRDPEPFLRAVDRLAAADPGLARRLDVRLAGLAREGIAGRIRAFADRPWLTLLPWLSLEESKRLQRESDLLLVIPGAFEVPGRSRSRTISVPGKAAEFLSSGKPILVLWTIEGDAEALLRDAGGVTLAPLGDADAIERALARLLERADGTGGGETEERRRRLAPYAWESIVERTAAALGEAASTARQRS
jgi:glycosyltransferase involved in cell wall biosynthesis